jgi:hypothetical protein
MGYSSHPIKYPSLTYFEGYIYLAKNASEMNTISRDSWEKYNALAKSGKMWLADSNGKISKIVGWQEIKPRNILSKLFSIMVGCVYAAPQLAEIQGMDLPNFKMEIKRAIQSRYRYDTEVSAEVESFEDIDKASTYHDVLLSVPWP